MARSELEINVPSLPLWRPPNAPRLGPGALSEAHGSGGISAALASAAAVRSACELILTNSVDRAPSPTGSRPPAYGTHLSRAAAKPIPTKKPMMSRMNEPMTRTASPPRSHLRTRYTGSSANDTTMFSTRYTTAPASTSARCRARKRMRDRSSSTSMMHSSSRCALRLSKSTVSRSGSYSTPQYSTTMPNSKAKANSKRKNAARFSHTHAVGVRAPPQERRSASVPFVTQRNVWLMLANAATPK
mmetsp:Transcript_10731/g.37397  ORF Transcript_10731/g.37397 Transcript_10731/m.37397 type:complete len:244 (-) Transcript_10731:431-1162(-)